jgi:NAD(P)-dependent dehydrogenase (short-subunit alcohol dehydrogenase family)
MQPASVLITGVHTGLGHALARRCLDDGARVFGLSRTRPGDLDGLAGFVGLDLRQLGEIPGATRRLLRGVDELSLVILNAGVLGEIKDLAETTVEELRRVMDLNVWANKVLIDTLMDGEREVRQVVAISSGAAFNGSGGWGAYSVSKSALNLLLRVYADEHPGTHFIALAPGVVDTPMLQIVLAQPENPRHPANRRIRQARAEGRVMPPDQAAERVLGCIPGLLSRPSGSFADVREL